MSSARTWPATDLLRGVRAAHGRPAANVGGILAILDSPAPVPGDWSRVHLHGVRRADRATDQRDSGRGAEQPVWHQQARRRPGSRGPRHYRSDRSNQPARLQRGRSPARTPRPRHDPAHSPTPGRPTEPGARGSGAPAWAKLTCLKRTSAVAGRSSSGETGSSTVGGVEQQFGELDGFCQAALQPPIDLVELEHDPCRVRVIGEGHHDRLHAKPPAAEADGEKHAGCVGEHGHRRDQGVDAEVGVVPGSDGEHSLFGDACLVRGGLAILSGEGSHRLHVHQAVGNVARHSCDGGLPLVDECLAATDKRRDDQPRDHDETKQDDDEERVVAPEHHRRERQWHDLGDDGERERVGELLEPRGEAQHALGQRTGEVVVEESRILGKQLVHADHAQVLAPAAARAVQAVQRSWAPRSRRCRV